MKEQIDNKKNLCVTVFFRYIHSVCERHYNELALISGMLLKPKLVHDDGGPKLVQTVFPCSKSV